MSLREYRHKRDFRKTREPAPKRAAKARSSARRIFVVQEHHARRLHWDFRLEWGGVLKSWAVTKIPTMNPRDRRLAIETEDHPLEYAKFKGEIPQGEYGAGRVAIWDHGTYTCDRSIQEEMDQGVIKFSLHGKKLKGDFVLVRIDREGSGPKSAWLFFKEKVQVTGLKIPKIA
jgi:bifunctional non-homologous end joining protein LigD